MIVGRESRCSAKLVITRPARPPALWPPRKGDAKNGNGASGISDYRHAAAAPVFRSDLDRHCGASFDPCLRQQRRPPSEQLVAVTSLRRATIDTDAPGAIVSATIWRFGASGYCRRLVAPGCWLVSTKPLV